jgi:benzodiazapine receptor
MRIPIESSTSYRGRNSRPNWLVFSAFVGLTLIIGAFGASLAPRVSAAAAAWYSHLAKPEWAPPTSWFGPLWTMVFALLVGTAGWLVWSERYHRARNAALAAFSVQLILTALWAPVFFGARNVGAGLFLIVALWLALIWTLREFATVKSAAAWALLPYVAWVSFLAALNLGIWRMNQ